MSNIAIVTNVAILLFTYDPDDTTLNDRSLANKWITFLIAEHVCIAMKMAVAKFVLDEPKQLSYLKQRHLEIEANVFFGQHVEETANLTEAAETTLDLTIHPSHAKVRRECSTAEK